MKPIIAAIFSLICFTTFAQGLYKISPKSELSFSGTSTLHDWTMVAEDVKGSAVFELNGMRLVSIKDINVKVDAESLKSGKTGMDKNTYKALNTDEYRYITFSLKQTTIVTQGSNYLVKGPGNLTISGTKKNIILEATCEVSSPGSITCEGSYTMKMTDFNVTPPTAMFGTIRTGDEITINFKTNFINEDLTVNKQ